MKIQLENLVTLSTTNNTIESFEKQELLSTSATKKLNTKDVRTPQFHILPKILKPSIHGRLM